MTSENTIQIQLLVNKTPLRYQSQPNSFQCDMLGTRGPTPGAILASTAGTDVSFAVLAALGGMCWLQNMDSSNFVTVGIWDSNTLRFYPLMELLPGEFYLIRLSRFLGEDYGTGTGTGTLDTGINLRIKADDAQVEMRIDAFDP